MRFFYDKKSGEYKGATSESEPCPEGCAETSARPAGSARFFLEGEWVEKKQAAPLAEKPSRKARAFDAAVYQAKAAAYSDRQLQAAMMRAKGAKLDILNAEHARRG